MIKSTTKQIILFRDRIFLVILHYMRTWHSFASCYRESLEYLSFIELYNVNPSYLYVSSFFRCFYHCVLNSSCLFWNISDISFTIEQFQ